MSVFERRILEELRMLREEEAALQASYEKLPERGAEAGQYFMASLKNLDERVNQFESFLERVA